VFTARYALTFLILVEFKLTLVFKGLIKILRKERYDYHETVKSHSDLSFSKGFPAKIQYKSIVSVTLHTCPAHGRYPDPTLS
jgi:hypothetical protein